MISTGLVILGYVLNALLNGLCLISFFYNDSEQEGILYLVAWLGNKIFPIVRYLIEINLALSAFIFAVDNVAAGFFFVTVLINIFITFFAQNYVLRKDYLCCKNMPFLIFYKVVVITVYAVDCVGQRTTVDKKSFITVLIILFLISLVSFIYYFISGYNCYRYSTPRYSLMGTLCILLSISV